MERDIIIKELVKPKVERGHRIEIARETAIALAAVVEVVAGDKALFDKVLEEYKEFGGVWDKIELRANITEFEDIIIKGKEVFKK